MVFNLKRIPAFLKNWSEMFKVSNPDPSFLKFRIRIRRNTRIRNLRNRCVGIHQTKGCANRGEGVNLDVLIHYSFLAIRLSLVLLPETRLDPRGETSFLWISDKHEIDCKIAILRISVLALAVLFTINSLGRSIQIIEIEG